MTLPPAESIPSVEACTVTTSQSPTSAANAIATISSTNFGHESPRQAPLPPSSHQHIAPASPSYPPYGYIDPNMAYELPSNGYHPNNDIQQQRRLQHQQQPRQPQQSQQAYVIYPISPHFYYPEYQSYPGSPVLLPQSPPMNPTSPPFSPTYPFQGGNNGAGPSVGGGKVTLSPTSHAAYVYPSHHPVHPTPPPPLPHFPPLHISSPVLTGTPVGSSPYQMVPLPGPYHPPSVQQHQPLSQRPQPQQQPQPQQLKPQRKQQQQRQHGRKPHHGAQSSHPNDHNVSLRDHSHYQQATSEELSMNHHPQNVYVRGLSSSTTDESFLGLCKAYGPVTSSKAILDQKTGECKGYGFALFEQEPDCHTAIEGLNNAGLQASLARIGQESFSSRLRNLQDESSTNIYISNLPLDMTEQKLEALFQPFKTVSSRILRDPQSGISRGVGFARMNDRFAADAIISRFNGHVITGSSASLQVRYADSVAQKKLKTQTSRKRVVCPREFQSMSASFSSIQNMMPITPETMLGITSLDTSVPTNISQRSHQPSPVMPSTTSMDPALKNLDTKQQDIDQLSRSVQENMNLTESSLDNKDGVIE